MASKKQAVIPEVAPAPVKAAKKPGTAVVTRKPKAGALTTWEAQLASAAVEVATAEASALGGRMISIRGGILSFAGQPIKENKLDVIILDSIFLNTYYEEAFDPDKMAAPICYAINRDEKELTPAENVQEDQNNGEGCTGCWANKFNSAEKGKGKACKNTRRLALITADALKADVITKQDIAFLNIPVTSIKGWALYVQKLANVLKRPPFGVVTRLTVQADPDVQVRVLFEPGKMIPGDVGAAVLAKVEEARTAIGFGYEASEADDAPVKRKGASIIKPASKKPKKR